MARLFSIGFEMGDAKKSWDAGMASLFGTVISETIRTGGGALQARGSIHQNVIRPGTSLVNSSAGTFYARTYMYIGSMNNAGTIDVFSLGIISPGTPGASMVLTQGSVLQLFNPVGGTNFGGTSQSPQLGTGMWHRLELSLGTALNAPVNAYLNGSLWGTAQTTSAWNLGVGTAPRVNLGYGWLINSGTAGTADLYFDDIALNDNTGANQNGLPGDGQIVYIRPNATGDNNSFGSAFGGAGGSANNFGRVNEVIPDFGTTYNQSSTLDATDDFAMPSSLGTIARTANINVIHVHAIANGAGASANGTIFTRLKAISGGAVDESTGFGPADNTWWRTNGGGTPAPFQTLYNKPSTSIPFSQADVDSMQIGYRLSGTNTNGVQVSGLLAIVDFTGSVDPDKRGLLGVGIG